MATWVPGPSTSSREDVSVGAGFAVSGAGAGGAIAEGAGLGASAGGTGAGGAGSTAGGAGSPSAAAGAAVGGGSVVGESCAEATAGARHDPRKANQTKGRAHASERRALAWIEGKLRNVREATCEHNPNEAA